MRAGKRPPVHPGRILNDHYLEPMSLTQTVLAERLGVSRKTISKIVNERGSITPDMALRLSRAFDTSPGLWLNLQQAYDLWQVSRESNEWRKVRLIEMTGEVGRTRLT